MYDLVIIGGGPAGVAAGVYAARKRLNTLLVAEVIGGQSTDSLDIQNWIGTPHIPGAELAKALEAHLKEYATPLQDGMEQVLTLKLGERAVKIEKAASGFSLRTDKDTYEAKTILIATGGSRRKLEVPGASEFEHKGVVYCASCDGPLFAGQDTVVVGGGNAGFETAAQLLAYAKSVTLLSRSDFSRADATTVEAVLKHPHMRALPYTMPTEVKGAAFVKSIVVKDSKTGTEQELPAGGIFVEIGALPSTEFAKGLVEMDASNHVKVDPRNQRASVAGVWAAGDCSDGLFHQNNIAAGDAVKALEDIYLYIKANTSAPSSSEVPREAAILA